MACSLFIKVIPAFRYNKKCSKTLGTFFIFTTIWAILSYHFIIYFRYKSKLSNLATQNLAT